MLKVQWFHLYSDVDHRHVYDTFDVTPLLSSDRDNAIGVSVAEGWYSRRLWAHTGNMRDVWGDTIWFQSLLVVIFHNVTRLRAPSDT